MIFLFFGDSLTLGYGDGGGLGLAGRLALHGPAKRAEDTWYNMGVRANTSRHLLYRWRGEAGRRVSDEAPVRIALCAGTADAAQGIPSSESTGHLDTLLTDMASMAEVLLIGPPPVLRDDLRKHLDALERQFPSVAARHGATFVSSTALLNSDDAFRQSLQRGDGVHPDAEGYARWAEHLATQPETRRFLKLAGDDQQ